VHGVLLFAHVSDGVSSLDEVMLFLVNDGGTRPPIGGQPLVIN
jgi:hypothetical protein